jgi:ABC-2 type transport system permease protein
VSTAGTGEILAAIRLELLRGIRGPRYLLLGVVLPLAVYVTYTVTGIGGAPTRSIGGITWPSYLMVSMAAFGAMNAAVGIAAGHPNSAVVGGRRIVAAVSAMVLALPPILLLASAGAIDGIQIPGALWLTFIVSLWLGILPFIALGLLLGPILDADTGDVVLLALLGVLAILGGLFDPIDSLPAALAALAPVLPSYHLADLGWTAIAARAVDPVDMLVLAGYTVGFSALDVWRKRSEGARGGD